MPLSAGLALSYPTSDCCSLKCLDIIFCLPNIQAPECNTSSPFHEPSLPSIICLAKEVVATISWCCISLLEIFYIFFPFCWFLCWTPTLLSFPESEKHKRQRMVDNAPWEEAECRPAFNAHSEHLRNQSLKDQPWGYFTNQTKGLRVLNPQWKSQVGVLPSCTKQVPSWQLI